LIQKAKELDPLGIKEYFGTGKYGGSI
jgi:hypothetical protein